MAIIESKNLNLYYAANHALKNINMEIEKNKVTALIGPSGCGKSTFLRTLNRMNDLIDIVRIEGQIFFEGKDIYKDYDGINNIKTINDCAGGEPVAVDQKVIDLLLFCRELYEATDGRVNTAMGSVLSLWHDARNAGIDDPENSALPEADALNKAAEHTGFEAIVIDEKAGTIQITDPEVRLDVGAIAKGYAVQRIAEASPSGLLISVGGNVCATGPKPVDESPWVVGVESPDKGAEEYLHTLYVEKGSVVTSGDYQRYYMVDGVRYHHIIDPDTKYPAAYWRSVTIVCEDSGLADALSTALFTLNQSDGQALLDRYHAEAMWVDADGNQIYSPGFSNFIRT